MKTFLHRVIAVVGASVAVLVMFSSTADAATSGGSGGPRPVIFGPAPGPAPGPGPF